MTEERKIGRRRRFRRLLAEYELNLRDRVQRGEIKEVTLATYLRDARRVLEALVFATEAIDVKKALRNYGYRGDYGKVIGDLKQIVEQRASQSRILRKT